MTYHIDYSNPYKSGDKVMLPIFAIEDRKSKGLVRTNIKNMFYQNGKVLFFGEHIGIRNWGHIDGLKKVVSISGVIRVSGNPTPNWNPDHSENLTLGL